MTATFQLLPLASTDWHCCMNGGAVSARINMKIAAELLHSGDHPWNANPQRVADRPSLCRSGGCSRYVKTLSSLVASSSEASISSGVLSVSDFGRYAEGFGRRTGLKISVKLCRGLDQLQLALQPTPLPNSSEYRQRVADTPSLYISGVGTRDVRRSVLGGVLKEAAISSEEASGHR